MAISREKKKEILETLKKTAQEAVSVVFVNFHGLSVSDVTEMRKGLRGKGVSYRVAKKTLISKAFKDAHIEGQEPVLEGELALSFGSGSDSLAPAREVYTFQKKYEGKLSILGGVFEKRFVGQEEMVSLAKIPPQEVLYGQFVNLINSPIQGLVIALDAMAQKKS